MRTSRTAAAGALLTLLTAVPARAAATPPGPGAHHATGIVAPEVLRRQAALDRLADAITEEVPEHRRATIPGYAGHTIDPQQGRLTLYWHGTVPQRITDLLTHTPPGITGQVRQAPFTLLELREARDRLVAAAEGGVVGAVWTSAGPAPDGTGLTVGYTPDPVRQDGARAREQIAARAAELAGVPVEATPAAAPTATATRHNDSAPWSAGAELYAPGNAFCTSGFGGWRGKVAVLLTAAHCGTSGTYKTGTGTVIGSVSDADTALDVAVITTNGTPSGRWYDGAYNNAAGSSRRVFGAGRNNVGDLVCSSGAMSGAHCALKIDRTDFSADVDGVWHSDLDSAVRTNDNDSAVAQGDSGGPVVASVTGGDDMQARGIMAAGTGNKVVCGDTAIRTVCYDTVAFTPIGPIVSKFGLSLA
ncbi:S1 family peptidase [Kitasatospora sp. NPDC056651]|uniref:S1 family peptidase n=1 Tax=Kitasatospora sp. NPDC056651 TaxID=3345892 RepID=UPI00368C77D0